METIRVPGWGPVEIRNLVLDLNGTMTEAGDFIPGVLDLLRELAKKGLKIYILSGDTRGNMRQLAEAVPGIEPVFTETAGDKRAFVEKIGPQESVCIGNGNIDVEMFKAARLSICTIQAEGAATKAVLHADVVVTHIKHAFEILLDPQKLVATLRA